MTSTPPMTRTDWHVGGNYVTTTGPTDYPPPGYAIHVELALKSDLEALLMTQSMLRTEVMLLRGSETELRERVESLEKLVVELARRSGINPEEL